MHVEQMPQIKIYRVEQSRINEVDWDNLIFGKHYSDHMFVADYRDGQWTDLRIVPYEKISVYPALIAFHYGQEIFEGLKAYRTVNGRVAIFRPDKNIKRMNESARRMAMPEFPFDWFLEAMKKLVSIDKDWVPAGDDVALYIRPFMIATDEYVGVRPSDTYKLFIITSPVGPYYAKPLNVKVERKFVRAFPGGTGDAKAAGNYGGAMMPTALAKEEGFDQLLWTDGIHHEYIEESGTMNVFFIINGTIITPPLTGTILPGVTRDSIITLCRDIGVPVEERQITVRELFEAHEKGILEDAFGSGTAVTIHHIARITDILPNGERRTIELPSPEKREISNRLKEVLEGIKRGKYPDRHSWLVYVD